MIRSRCCPFAGQQRVDNRTPFPTRQLFVLGASAFSCLLPFSPFLFSIFLFSLPFCFVSIDGSFS